MEREEGGGYLPQMAGDVMSSPLRLMAEQPEPVQQHQPQRRHVPLAPAPLAPQLGFNHDLCHNKRSSIYGLLN
jgi:hypothetical protein